MGHAANVTIFKGSKIIRADSGAELVSQKDFVVELVTYKMGKCYYRVGESIYRTSQWNVKEWLNEYNKRRAK